jgi:hypothetical protein
MAEDLEAILPPDLREGLTEAEKRLLAAAPSGETASCGPSRRLDVPADDPKKSESWGKDREIRAGLIRWLCVDREAQKLVRVVAVRGAKITGELQLSLAAVPFPLKLARCRFLEGIDLSYLKIPSLDLGGAAVEDINATGAEVRGDFLMDNGFSATDGVQLSVAQIGGNLTLLGSVEASNNDYAFAMNHAVVKGDVQLRSPEGLEVFSGGGVTLQGAEIGGDLWCGGTFKNSGNVALYGDGLKVAGSVFLEKPFSAEGEVRLESAHIGGFLICNGGKFKNPGRWALSAEGARIGITVKLRDGFSAEGEVDLEGAQIVGSLNCDGGSFKNPGGTALYAKSASIGGDLSLQDGFSAEGEVDLTGSQIGVSLVGTGGKFKNPGANALLAEGSVIRAIVFLNKGFEAEGKVSISSTQIGSDLDCEGGKFKNPGGTALFAESAIVGSNALLSEGFSTVGELHLGGVQIGGYLWCNGALKNPGSQALFADNIKVAGDFLLDDEFVADGEIRLGGAQIGGNLKSLGSKLRNPGGKTLQAEGAEIKSSVLLANGFSSEGEMDMFGVRIGEALACSGSFKNPRGTALDLGSAEIKGDVLMTKYDSKGPGIWFSTEGEVSLFGTQIGGSLFCFDCSLNNPTGRALDATSAEIKGNVLLADSFCAAGKLDFEGARIGGSLITYGWKKENAAKFDLANAMTASIEDNEDSWPDKGNLELDGFVYGNIRGGPRDAASRIRWLELQDGFYPSSYRQLAKVLRDMGDEDGHKQVLYAMEKRAREEGRHSLSRAQRPWSRRGLLLWPRRIARFIQDSALDLAVGDGIYPEKAAWYLAGLTALGWLVHWRAKRVNAMAPTEKEAYRVFHENGNPPKGYPPFNPFVYSLENCTPLVKFGQDDHWHADPHPESRSKLAPGRNRKERIKNLAIRIDRAVTSPVALRWLRWLMIGLGWLLATFFVAGISGLIKSS